MSADEKTPLTKEQEASLPVYSTLEQKQPTVIFAPHAYSTISGPVPDDYMVFSLLTILFCFWPIGIVALLRSIEVRNALARGDLTSAQRASRMAHKYNKLAVLVGVLSTVVIVTLILLAQLWWIIPTIHGGGKKNSTLISYDYDMNEDLFH